MSEYLVVLTTTEKREDAERIARALVEDRLAACVQVLPPIHSTYWWEGEVESGEEYLCLIKTRREIYGAVEASILENHPYDTPEIVALPIEVGLGDYLRWIDTETGGSA